MSTTAEQVKEELRIYEAIENSSIGSLLKEGRMYIGISSKDEVFHASWNPLSKNHDSFNKSDYNMTDEEFDKLLESIKQNLSYVEFTPEPLLIESKYGYAVFEVNKEKVKRLSFGTVYNIHEIFDVRCKNNLLPD